MDCNWMFLKNHPFWLALKLDLGPVINYALLFFGDVWMVESKNRLVV